MRSMTTGTDTPSRPQTFREVDLPDEWETYSRDAKVNYLSNVMDRDQLLSEIADLADLADESVGEQSLKKSGLAELFISLQNNGD